MIELIKSEQIVYEVGKDGVGFIEKTTHGNEKTTIYKVSDSEGQLIIFVGLIKPHEVIKRSLE